MDVKTEKSQDEVETAWIFKPKILTFPEILMLLLSANTPDFTSEYKSELESKRSAMRVSEMFMGLVSPAEI